MLFSQFSLTIIFQTPDKVLGHELKPKERERKKKKEKCVPPEDSQQL